ncbi:hypothetical protein, unlikely [Trypanosoma congolense IL3000]|uniref:Uncharacterized protein n=1 Tax=Trypanosoma congolense (strain IL3000) TaxID=1068625 RepID=F9WJ30_TRYCI|nr:hypothetical protein, unlikely [Trypanosoma congolense IL3000]
MHWFSVVKICPQLWTFLMTLSFKIFSLSFAIFLPAVAIHVGRKAKGGGNEARGKMSSLFCAGFGVCVCVLGVRGYVLYWGLPFVRGRVRAEVKEREERERVCVCARGCGQVALANGFWSKMVGMGDTRLSA